MKYFFSFNNIDNVVQQKNVVRFFLFMLFCIFCLQVNAQDGVQVDYSVTPPTRDPRAILELNSTNQGFLVPRVNSTADVGSPSNKGMLVYQITGTEGFYYWTGSAWVMIANTTTGIVTADNGLNVNTGNNVRLGGTISVNPTDIALAGNTLTFSGTGNSKVGIGTTSPPNTARLYVESASSNFEGIRGINVSSSTTGGYGAIKGDVAHTNYTNASGYLGYHTTGNQTYGVYGNAGDYGGVFARPVSISTVSPTSTSNDLEVRNIAGSNPVQVFFRQSASNATSGTVLSNIDFGDNNTSTAQARIQAVRDAPSSGSSDLPTAIAFSTTADNSTTLLERMRITNTGNVGIGNTNPGSLLFVGSGSIPGGPLSGINVSVGTASYVTASDGTRTTFIGSDGSGYGMAGTLTNHDFVIRSNNTERMRVFSGGTVRVSTLGGSGGNRLVQTNNNGDLSYSSIDPATVTTTSNISGTTNYVAKFTAANSIGNSQLFDNGSNVRIGDVNNGTYKLNVSATDFHTQLRRESSETTGDKRLFLELYQNDPSNNIPEVYPIIRFHHNNKFWNRIEARGNGIHFKEGGLTGDSYVKTWAGDGYYSGSVGIGSTTPGSKLDVQGGHLTVGTLYGTNVMYGTLGSFDTRSTNPNPETYNMGVVSEFKANASNGLNDGGTYNSVLSIRQWSSGGDWSGGGTHQLGLTQNGNLWHRYSQTTGSWGAWKRVLYTTDIPGGVLPTGTSGQTLRHNGTSWIANSLLYNDGTNVGIGTTSPNAKLHIGAFNDNHLLLTSSNNAYGWRIDTRDNLSGNVPFRIFRRTAGTDTEVFSIKNQDGNIGMGISDPGAFKLNVFGDARVGETSARHYLDISSSIWPEIRFTTPSFTSDMRIGMAHAANGTYGVANGDWYVYSPGVDRMDLIVQRAGGISLAFAGGNVGIGTNSTVAKLVVRGTTSLGNGNNYANANNFMASGSLTVGGINTNFGGGSGWNSNTAGILMETLDNTEIGIHDSGLRIASAMYYTSANNRITVGRDMGWGTTNFAVANLSGTGNRPVYADANGVLTVASGGSTPEGAATVVPIATFGGEPLINSTSWQRVTRTTYSSIAAMFSGVPVTPGATRKYYLVIRRADNQPGGTGSHWRFACDANWNSGNDVAGHGFSLPSNWGSLSEGSTDWVEIPPNAVSGAGCGTSYWKIDARMANGGQSMRVMSVSIAAIDVVGGSNPAYSGASVGNATSPAHSWLQENVWSNGNRVGIGTSNPGSKLQVHKDIVYNGTGLPDWGDRSTLAVTGTYPHIIIGSSVNNVNHAGTLSFWHNNNGGGTTNQWNIGASDAGLTIGFATNDGNPHAGLENYNFPSIMSFEQNGNVGIGTTNPTQKLDVNGKIAIRGVRLEAFFKNPLSGGGNLRWQGNVLSWTERIIVIPAGDAGAEHMNTAPWGSNTSPTSVTIGQWEVAYMRPTDADLTADGGSYNPIQVVSYPGYDPIEGDVIVAVHNGDNGMLYTGWGIVMPPNSAYTRDGLLLYTGGLPGTWHYVNYSAFDDILETGIYGSDVATNKNIAGQTNYLSFQASGYVQLAEGTGNYYFRTCSDDGSTMYVNNNRVMYDFWSNHGTTCIQGGPWSFTNSNWVPILVQHRQGTGGERFYYEWYTPNNQTWHSINSQYLGYPSRHGNY